MVCSFDPVKVLEYPSWREYFQLMGNGYAADPLVKYSLS